MGSRLTRLLAVWGPAAAWAVVLFFLSELQSVPPNVTFATNDKAIHVVLYAVLGATLGWAWFAGRFGFWSARRVRHGIAFGLGLAYAVFDELHQLFVPNRFASTTDLLADAIGLVLGYVFATVTLSVAMGRRTAVEVES